MTMDYTRIEVEDREDRMVVRLNRPETRNAIDFQLGRELHDVCGRLEEDPKPMLLMGSHGIFAAGVDISQLLERGRKEALAGINSSLFERVHRLPMPTIAAVDGFALGGGAELAFACDIRVATPGAVFGNPEPDLGIIAGAGATWRLPQLVGMPLAKLVLLAGHRIEAEQALSSGLVAAVVESGELEATAMGYIDRMSRMSPIALRLTKYVVDADTVHPYADLIANALLFEDSEKRSRMQAFLDKRKPRAAESGVVDGASS